MANNPFDQFDAGPNPFDRFDDGQPEPSSSLWRRLVADPAISLIGKGAISVPETAVGIADLVTGGYAGKAAEAVGFRPKEAKEYLDTLLSPEQQEANRYVQEAEGFFPTIGRALERPSTIVHSVLESLPSVGAGGVVARGAMKAAPKLKPLVAGAAGEGTVSAGLTAEQVRQQTPTGTISLPQSLLAAGSGAATMGFGVAGGKLAHRLGIADIDTLIAAGKLPEGARKSLARRIGEGIFIEGPIEELPQSLQEQIAQNLALGEPWQKGTPQAGAMGMLAGGVMGGGVATLTPTKPPVQEILDRNPDSRKAAEELLQKAAEDVIQGTDTLAGNKQETPNESQQLPAPGEQAAPEATPEAGQAQEVTPISGAMPKTVGGIPVSAQSVEQLRAIAQDPEANANTRRAALAALNPEAQPAPPVAESQVPVAVSGESQGDRGVAPTQEGGLPEVAMAVQDIPTTEKMRLAIEAVGEDEFRRQAQAKIEKYKPINPKAEAMLVEATATEILAIQNLGSTEQAPSVSNIAPVSVQEPVTAPAEIAQPAEITPAPAAQPSPTFALTPVPAGRKIVRGQWRGEFHVGDQYIGDLHEVAPGEWRILSVDNGQVLAESGPLAKGDFKKTGSYAVSASQKVARFAPATAAATPAAPAVPKPQPGAASPVEPVIAPEKPAIAPKPEESRQIVETFTGQYKKGLGSTVARQQQKRLSAEKPTLTWEIEPAPEFGEQRFKLVGYGPTTVDKVVPAETLVADIYRAAENVHDKHNRRFIPAKRADIVAAIERAQVGGVEVTHTPAKQRDWAEQWSIKTKDGKTYLLSLEPSGRSTWHATTNVVEKAPTVAEKATISPEGSKVAISPEGDADLKQPEPAKEAAKLLAKPTGQPVGGYYALDTEGNTIGQTGKGVRRFKTAKEADIWARKHQPETAKAPEAKPVETEKASAERAGLYVAKPEEFSKFAPWVGNRLKEAEAKGEKEILTHGIAREFAIYSKGHRSSFDGDGSNRGSMVSEASGNPVEIAMRHGEDDIIAMTSAAKKEIDERRSELEAKRAAEEAKQQKERAETERRIEEGNQYFEAIRQVKMPKGEKKSLTFNDTKGEPFTIEGTDYNGLFIHKTPAYELNAHSVTDTKSGLRIAQLDNLAAAKDFVRAVIHANLPRTDLTKLSKTEKAQWQEVYKAHTKNGEVPKYFTEQAVKATEPAAEPTPPAPETLAEPTPTIAEMSPADLLRAAADKMEAAAKPSESSATPAPESAAKRSETTTTVQESKPSTEREQISNVVDLAAIRSARDSLNRTIRAYDKDTREELRINLDEILAAKEEGRFTEEAAIAWIDVQNQLQQSQSKWNADELLEATDAVVDALSKRTKFAKGEGIGITEPTLRAEIAKAFGPRAERLVGDILIPLNTQADIAGVSELADVALQIREGDLIKGFYHPMTGKTYAVLENLDPGDGKGLVLHEIGVHLGLGGMLGQENYAKLLRQMDAMRKAGNKVVIEAHEQATAQAVSEDQIPEESIAYLVTYAPQLPFVQRIISQIKAFLFRKFGILGDRLTPDDITALAKASVLHASEGVRNGEAQFVRVQDQTQTPEFKKWFGDSKVVDADGKPLVVYHGTTEPNITVFEPGRKEPGVWFTLDIMTANDYAKSPDGDIHKVFLSIRNPLKVWFDEIDGQLTPTVNDVPINLRNNVDIVKYAQRNGFDGVHFENGNFSENSEAWVAFRPEQIKSAIGNTGAFDPTNPDIRFQRTNEQGGAIGQVLRSPKLTGLMSAFKSPASFGIFRNINTQFHKAVTLEEQGKPHFKAVFDKVQDYINDISAIAVSAEQKAPAIFREITGLRPSSFKLHFKGAAKKSDIMAIAPWLNYGTLYGGGNPFEGRIWTKEELTSGFAIDTTKDGTSLRVRTGLKPLTEWQAELYLQARAALDQSIEDGAKAVVYRHVKRHDIDFAKTESLDRVVMTVKEQLETRKNEHSIRLEQADDTLNQAQDRVRDAETAYNINRRDFAAREELTAATKNLEKKQKQRDKIQADLDAITALLGTKEERGTIDKLHEHAQGLIDHGYMPLKRFGNKTVEARDKDNKVKFFGAYDGIPLVPYSATAEMNRVAAELKALHPEWTVSTGIKSERSWQMYNGLSLDALENFLDFLDPETKAELERDKTVQEYLTRAVNNRSVLKEMIHRKGTPGFSQDTDRVLASFITSHARNASAMYHIGEARGLIEQIPNEQGDIKDEATDLVNYVADPGEEAAKLRGFLFFHFLGGSIAAGIINLTQTPMMTIPRLSQDAPFKDVLKAAASAAKLAVMDPQTINSEKGRALQKAEREGITSPQQIYHLAAIASNNPFSSNKHFRTLMTVWGGLFATSEVFNRRVAFLSAYDTAKTNGKNETEAYTYAKGIVDETQLIYNKGNRMNWGRGPLGATILTFKTFTVGYLELLSRLPPKQQLMMLGVLLLASGLEGLPGEDDMEDVVNTLGQWLGFATNTGKWTGKVIRDNLGEEFERPILKGLGGMLAIDLHSRLGFGNIVPGTAFFVPSEINKGRDVAEAVGPVGSVFRNFMDSLALAARGKWDKAAIHSAPKAVRDLYNGMHMLATGESEDIKGRRGLTDVTTGEAFGKLIGFNPQRAAIESEAKREAMTDKNLRTIRMDEIASDWADAILRKDARKRQAAAERFRAWNRDNPEMMIAWAQMTRSVQERARAARKTSKERFLKSLPKAMRREAQGSFQ